MIVHSRVLWVRIEGREAEVFLASAARALLLPHFAPLSETCEQRAGCQAEDEGSRLRHGVPIARIVVDLRDRIGRCITFKWHQEGAVKRSLRHANQSDRYREVVNQIGVEKAGVRWQGRRKPKFLPGFPDNRQAQAPHSQAVVITVVKDRRQKGIDECVVDRREAKAEAQAVS